ncbi:MAG TPA: nitronate monooxygenase [Dehalococcoidia bacterium]|nr:nitronate monooxygenase [Dehalococcoidia bacterium]
MNEFLRTPLCDLFGIEYPIIQAGMGHIARADLCAAVSNAGGLGVIGASGMEADELREEIRRVRQLTDRPFGVDLILPANIPEGDREERVELPPVPDWLERLRAEHGISEAPDPVMRVSGTLIRRQVQVILDEKVPVFASGLGNPAWLVPDAHAQGMKVIAVVGNVKNARRVAAGGADLVVAQGYDGGGHTGRIGTMSLVPQVVDAVRPTLVAAAGGIADGRGLVAALALGAAGVWVGTRFGATVEARSHVAYKDAIVGAADEDVIISKGYTGKTCRVIRNRFTEEWEKSGLTALPMPLQGMWIGRSTHIAARERGITALGSMPAGQGSGLISEIKPAGEVVQDIMAEAQAVFEQIGVPVPRR